MNNKIVVLGSGLVGNVIAKDLSRDNDVTVIDKNEIALKKCKNNSIKTIKADLSNKNILLNNIKNFDLVIGAMPGFLGFETLKTVIQAKKNIVDISFFPEDPFELDNLAKKNNVIAVMDCGVAPGMGNIILGNHNKKMSVEKYECLVGGLPLKREWPYEYKAGYCM